MVFRWVFIILFGGVIFLSTASAESTLKLTEEEAQWIQDNPVIKLGSDYSWPPYDFLDDNQTHAGISADFLALISDKTGLKFDVTSGVWSDIMQMVKSKELDGLACAMRTPERETFLRFTTPYSSMPLAIVVQKDRHDIRNFDDLKGQTVAVNKDSYLHEWMQNNHPDIPLHLTISNSESLHLTSTGAVDAYVGNIGVTTYVLNEEFITNLKVVARVDDFKTETTIAILQEKPMLVSILQKALDAMTPLEKAKIRNHWFAESAKQLVSFTGDPNWLPYEAFDKDGRFIGIVADFLNEVEANSDLVFEKKMVATWDEALNLAKQGQIDVLSADLENQSKLSLYRPIPTYLSTPIVILMNQDHEFVNDLEDLPETNLVVMRKAGYTAELIQEYPDNRFLFADSDKDALAMLKSGKAQAVLLPMPRAMYWIKEYQLHDSRIVGKTHLNMNLTLFVHQDKPALFEALQKSMRQAKQEEGAHILSKWSKIEFAEKTDYVLLAQIAGALLILIAFIVYWNVKLSREISHRKVLEDELIRSRAQVQVLIDSVPLRMMVTNLAGDILSVNAQVMKDYQMTLEQIQSRNVTDYYVNTEDREAITKKLKTQGKVNQEVVMMKDLSGHPMPMMLSIIPIEYNQQSALLSIGVDMSERVELENQLSDAKELAEAANRAKSEFLANMSHEIRTPMNAILGFTELLREQVKESRLKHFVETISSAGNSLMNLINDILDLSKIEAGKMEISHASTNPYDLFKEISDIFMMNVRAKGIDFVLSVDDNLPQSLLLDAIRLRQVMFNLIGNAVKFTDSGYVKLSVQAINFDEARSKVDLVMRVEDTGIGIAEDDLQTIFGSFQQQAGQDAQKFGGTGLGLSISQRLVELMGGHIEVQSKQGVGSTFTVFLEEVDIASVVEQKALNDTLSFDANRIRFVPASILIVDDVEDNRELVRQSLNGSQLDVADVQNGQEAVAYCQENHVDLVLMDIRMPVMDGYEATSRIKSRHPSLPVVALTASVMRDEHEKIEAGQFDGYLRKPVLRGDLFQTLTQFLSYETVEKWMDEGFEKSDLSSMQLETILESIHQQLWALYERAKQSNSVDDIRQFGHAEAELAVKLPCERLDRHASLLLEAVESFNILAMKQLMNEFADIVVDFEQAKSAK